MTVLRNQNSWDKSNVRFSDGRIVTYDKVNRTADMQHIDWGLGVISAEAVRHRAEETAFDLADTYRELLNIDQLLGYEVDHRFYEIGSAEGIAETDRYLRQKTRQHC
jgi:NDP-sugar pyrophosphorylase family protein